jgi:hypothetical protein
MEDPSAACVGYSEDLSALLDGELPPERETALRAHVEGCAACARRLAELGRVDLALSSTPLPAVPAQLRARLEQRIAADAAPAERASRGGPGRAAPPRRRLYVPAAGLAAAAAAALYLVLRPDEPSLPGAGPAQPPVAVIEPVAPAPAPAPPAERSEIARELPAPSPPKAPPAAEPTAPVPRGAPAGQLAERDPSEQDLEELGLVLELDTLQDLEVIANLDLLERLVALEEGASG